MEKGNFKLSTWWWALCAPALMYAFYRSIQLDITNDEAYSFKLVAELTRHFVPARNLMYGTANTHWLNSLFIFIEHHLLGDHVWMLRIHNVLALGAMCYGFYRIAKHLQAPYYYLLLCLLIPFNHYLFDFFSLARGYGLSLAFEVLAFSFIIIDAERYRARIYWMLSLAVLSNYTVIYFLLVYGLVDLIRALRTNGFSILRSTTFYKQRMSAILVLLWAISNIYYIKYVTGDLEEGQRNGFIPDTLGVFLGRSWDVLNYPVELLIGVLWLTILLVYVLLQRKKMQAGWNLFLMLVFLVVCLIHVLYVGLNIPFPFGRTSFFLIVPLLMLLAWVLHQVARRYSVMAIVTLVFVVLLWNGYYVLHYRNMRVTQEWWMQQGIHQFVDETHTEIGSTVKQKHIAMSIDHWGVYTNYYQFLYPEKTFDSVFVYDRFGYSSLPQNDIERMKQCDYLLLINDYHSFLQEHWKQPIPQVMHHYTDMKSDFLKKQ